MKSAQIAFPNLVPVLAETPQAPVLLTPLFNLFFVGGLAILVYALVVFHFGFGAPGVAFFEVPIFVNLLFTYPHLLGSYRSLYTENRHKILRQWRYFLVAVVTPLLLLSLCLYAVVFRSLAATSALVGWVFYFKPIHFVMQSYGCFLLLCESSGLRFSKLDKRALKFHLLSVVPISAFSLGTNGLKWIGIPYHPPSFPGWILSASYLVFFLSGAIALVAIGRNYTRQRLQEVGPAAAALFTGYLWTLPWFWNPICVELNQVFHSLQYLLVSLSVQRNKFSSEHVPAVNRQVIRYYLGSLVLGFSLLFLVPLGLQQWLRYDTAVLGRFFFTALLVAAFNAHHFLIDGVIWRRENEEMQRFLKSRIR